MSLYSRYKLKRGIETAQVILAWLISYIWFVPYILLDLAFLIFLPILLVSAFKDSFALGFAAIAGSLLIFILINWPAFHVFIRIRKQYRGARDLSGLEKLPEAASNLVRQRIEALAGRMEQSYQEQLRDSQMLFYVERKNHKATPSMLVIERKLNLILPLGFFKILQADPEAADAMLAHEMAHYLHRDSGLLLAVRCYLKAATVIFYYIAVGFVLNLIFSLPALGKLNRQSFAYDLSLNDSHTSEISRYWDEVELEKVNSQRTRLIFGMVFHFSLFYYYALVFFFLRRRVQRSEELADLFASIVTHPQAVRRFLNEYMSDDNYGWSSLHPPVARRVKYANRYERLLA